MKNLFPYMYDFLSVLFENKDVKNKVKRGILFGSVARDEFDKESDIDLFIDVWSKNDISYIESMVQDAEKSFFAISEKKWSLLGISFPIKTIVGILEDEEWKELRLEMSASGIIFYGKFEVLEGNLNHYAMFNYSLSRLKQNKKMAFLRRLFGYKSIKNKKEYRIPGLLEKIGGVKLNSNVILVPVEKSRDVQKFLNSFKITPEIRDILIK